MLAVEQPGPWLTIEHDDIPDVLPASTTRIVARAPDVARDVAPGMRVRRGTTPALGSSVTVAQAGSCEVGAAGTCHAVPLTGLLPGTRYYYRLLDQRRRGADASATYFHDAA